MDEANSANIARPAEGIGDLDILKFAEENKRVDARVAAAKGALETVVSATRVSVEINENGDDRVIVDLGKSELGARYPITDIETEADDGDLDGRDSFE